MCISPHAHQHDHHKGSHQHSGLHWVDSPFPDWPPYRTPQTLKRKRRDSTGERLTPYIPGGNGVFRSSEACAPQAATGDFCQSRWATHGPINVFRHLTSLNVPPDTRICLSGFSRLLIGALAPPLEFLTLISKIGIVCQTRKIFLSHKTENTGRP